MSRGPGRNDVLAAAAMQCQPSFHARTMERLDHSNTRRYISAFEDRLETASHPRLNYANRDREISSIRGGGSRKRGPDRSLFSSSHN